MVKTVSGIKQGRLITNGVILKEHEMMTINLFLGLGYDIELIPKSNKRGEHSPDAKILNRLWEIKMSKRTRQMAN